MEDEKLNIDVTISGFVFRFTPLERLRHVSLIGDLAFGTYINDHEETLFSARLEPEEYVGLKDLTDRIKERLARDFYEQRNAPILNLNEIESFIKSELEETLSSDLNEDESIN